MTTHPYQGTDRRLTLILPVLGVPTLFESNSAAVIDAVASSYGEWTALAAHSGAASAPAARVRITVRSPDSRIAEAVPTFRYRVPEPSRMVVEWDGGSGSADSLRLESRATVTPGLVERPAELVAGVVEPLTLFLLGALDRQPLHAAAVVRDGVAILLAAPSGTGKSTLSYAASRQGYGVLADEPVYVQLKPALRVWGRRPRLHLPVEARAHFPELAGREPTRLPSGKTKIVIDRPETVRFADQAGICLLRRSSAGGVALERVAPTRVVAELTASPDPGFDLFAATIGERILAIASRGAWRLTLPGPPQEALPLLDEVAAELLRRGG